VTARGDEHRRIASAVLTQLSSVVVPRWRPNGMSLAHLPSAIPEEAASLPLPSDPGARGPAQSVTLVAGDDFQRETDEAATAQQYAAWPRTRVMESIETRSDGWPSLISLRLAGMVRRRVVCALYESRQQDTTMGPHQDHWDGVIVQMRGAKLWRLWTDPSGQPREVLTRAGDVLLIPRGVEHDVSTPDYSAHLAFAITDRPLAGT
jgi:hypothetical protein